jgi:hypothetical protein
VASPGSPEDVGARADAALLRASRAGLAAEREEHRARTAPSPLRDLHRSMARLHRQVQRRHETAAALQLAYARRLGVWDEGWDDTRGGTATRPDLLTCVGDVVGAESAVTLQSSDGRPAVIATSGELAYSAMQLELTVGEGPMHDCLSRNQAISAVRPSSAWPAAYGGGAEHLGVTTVAANPLDAGGRHLGVMLTFNARPVGPGGFPVHLPTVAAAVTDSLLGTDLPSAPDLRDWDVMGPPGRDTAALIHCASGIISENLGCSPEEALTLLVARALASGDKVESVASGIIGEQQRTSPDRSELDTS